MAFKLQSISIEQARAQFATSKDTALKRLVAELVDYATDEFASGAGAVGPISMEQLETQSEEFGDFVTAQREKPARKDGKSQVPTIQSVYNAVNRETEQTNVRAILVDGKKHVLLVNAEAWKADIDKRKAAGEDVSEDENGDDNDDE